MRATRKTLALTAALALAGSSSCGSGHEIDRALAVTERLSAGKSKWDDAIDSITGDQERAVGQAAAINVIANYGGLVLDEDLVKYVNEVGNLVARQGERKVRRKDGSARIKSRRMFVGVLDHPSRNAFSLPGGYVLVTKGLLDSLQSESELAWVLGHEMAHADWEHGLSAMKTRMGMAGGFAGVTNTSFNLADSGIFKKFADALAEGVVKNGWDQKAETDADKWGLQYSTRAGYDPKAAARVLGVLASEEAEKGPPKEADKSHQSPEQRYAVLKDLVAKSSPGAVVAERYDTGCLQRLEAYAIAHAGKGSGTN